jgi:hypothetical protein
MLKKETKKSLLDSRVEQAAKNAWKKNRQELVDACESPQVAHVSYVLTQVGIQGCAYGHTKTASDVKRFGPSYL